MAMDLAVTGIAINPQCTVENVIKNVINDFASLKVVLLNHASVRKMYQSPNLAFSSIVHGLRIQYLTIQAGPAILIYLMLEPRKYKNDSIQSKIIPTMKLPRFLTTYMVREKARQFQNRNHFLQNGVVLILSLLY